MSPQKPETDPRALAHRAAEELAKGGYQAAQTTALVAIAGALAGEPSARIHTADELIALPDRSVVLDRGGEAWQRNASHHLADLYGEWFTVESEVPHTTPDIPLPARVIHLGGC
ncbi:hypothetical protein [Mycobacterium sp. NAZ190054]|uniref:hypothetical protein n=1 Tax=Mycobacterium sp. NAZ190054 TaxID=1747766 RepID=UPI00079168C7|nr:hypothetical protein [Mycobacterium sp. NAZ190054]KWX66823.1 hypothetical protein ASJ79_05515 [Mycobacterium sp. NAZ190054]